MFRRKKHEQRVSRGFIKRTSEIVIKRSSRVSISGNIGRSEVNRWGRRGSMLMRKRRNKRRVIWQRKRERKRRADRAKFVRARGREDGVMQRNVNAVSITRGVDIRVIAVVGDELMEVSERNTNEEVE